MFDTHCHIQFNGFKNDYDEVIKRCVEKDSSIILNAVGTQKDTSRAAVEFAQKYPFIYASVGLHPMHLFSTHVDEEESSFLTREENFDYEYYKKLGQSPKVIAIGECGLDLYRLPEGRSKEEVLEKQKLTFLAQCKLAQELDLPMVIHVREAHEEMVGLLSSLSDKIRATIHCYTGNWHYAQKYLALGLHLGFTGVITFPPRKSDPQAQEALLEVVKNCPLDRMLLETDAPYLAANLYRGKRCEPWMVEEVAKKIAYTKGLSFAEVIEATTKNAQNLFQKAV
ncbi:MAG TPA: TatD family hydrolase [Candidatus Udaeobacter sp.]|nr:TatD family hydrolase [Candidatus Udaeobacter sp.]